MKMTMMLLGLALLLCPLTADAGKTLDERLRGRITLNVTDAPLTDVVQMIGTLLDVNLLVDRELQREREPKELRVTLTVNKLRGDHALKLICELKQLAVSRRHGVLIIGSEQNRLRRYRRRLYDVRALMIEFKDFKAPDVRLAMPRYTRRMSCYCCGWEHDPGNDFSERETLMQVIKDNAVPDSWEDDERTSLDFAKGHLVVNQTEEGHRAVKRLLAQLSQLR